MWNRPVTVKLRTGRYTKIEQCMCTFLAFMLEPMVFYLLYTNLKPISIMAYPEIFNLLVIVVALILTGMALQIAYTASVYRYEARNRDCAVMYVITGLNVITAVVGSTQVWKLDLLITGLVVLLFCVKSFAFKKKAITEYTFSTSDPIATLNLSEGESLSIDLLSEQLFIMRENDILIKNSDGDKAYRPEDVTSINIGDTVAVYDGSNWVKA